MHTHGLRFDVNCSILFTELPLQRRPAAAKAAGFDAVEFWWPWTEMVPADPGDSSTSFGWL
jgi:hydroxypyruvate isomerase